MSHKKHVRRESHSASAGAASGADDTITRLSRLRADGEHVAAFSLLSDELKKQQDDPLLILETVQQALLMGQVELAEKLYKQFEACDSDAEIHRPHVRARLALLREQSTLTDIVEQNSAEIKLWLAELLRDGQDPLYPANLVDLHLDCGEGTAIYHLFDACPSCGFVFRISVELSFLVYRELLCPDCLARHFLDGHLLIAAARRKFTTADLKQLRQLGHQLQTMKLCLNDDHLDQNEFPRLGQYLYMDYVFFLNEFLLRHHFSCLKP